MAGAGLKSVISVAPSLTTKQAFNSIERVAEGSLAPIILPRVLRKIWNRPEQRPDKPSLAITYDQFGERAQTEMGNCAMSKRSSKSKHPSNALGLAGVPLALVSGASASIGEATVSTLSASQSDEIFLDEEEIFDVSLSTFYVFDKENTEAPPRAQQLAARGHGCCGVCASCGRSCGKIPAAWRYSPRSAAPHLW